MAEQFVERLKSLIQLDYDATQAYEQAIANIEEEHISSVLQIFRNDHQRHIDDLSRFVRNYGEEPPELSRDFKGFLIEGMTSIMSAAGTKAALTAMKTNENLTNKKYDQALQEDMPQEVKDVVQRNYQDEKRHLSFIERALDQELWNDPSRAAEESHRISSGEGFEARL